MLKLRTTKTLYEFIKPYHYLALKALVLTAFVSVLEVISTALVLPLTQILGNNQPSVISYDSTFLERINLVYNHFSKEQQLLIVLLALLFTSIAKNFTLYLSSISINDFTLRAGTLLRQKCIKRFLELEIPFYGQTSLGELLSYVNEQAQRSERLFSSYLEIAREIIITTFLLTFLISLSPVLTSITLASLTIVAFSVRAVIRGVQTNGQKSAKAIESFSSLITELISGIRVIKSFNTEAREFERSNHALQSRYITELTAYRFNSAVAPITETFGIVVLLVILLAGESFLSSLDSLALPVLLTYTLALLRTLPRVSQLNSLRSQLSLLTGSFEIIQTFLSNTAESHLTDGACPYQRLKTELMLEDLSFTYATNTEPTLDRINLRIIKGTTTAFVGPSGSGKSTLVDLVMRFYDPDQGSIQVDGIDLRELQVGSWRRAIAMVSQDTFLFNASVRENIAYGHLDATDSDVIAAAKKAHAYEFIQDLPQRFDTIVGNRGTRLSGGQRQRIAIARAILCDPDILILDEATSALDSTSERIVQKAIEEVSRDRTVIVIAHRLSTIINADNIVVLQNGRVVEQGTHSKLLEKRGVYYTLYQSQALSHNEAA